MPINKKITTGQAIRRIRAGEIAPVYTLFGGDPFLEDYFISELKTSFLRDAGSKLHFSLDQDSPDILFRELSSISLFEEKRIIIVREIKKLRTEGGRKELIQYIEFPTNNTVLVLIAEEYDIKNSFLRQISDLSEFMDFRPPFENEMKKWARYILNSRHIQITDSALDEYIELYGDSIAHVINEAEKMAIMLGEGKEINDENISQLDGYDRVFHLWNLQDSLGKKDLEASLNIVDSLFNNGTKITGILVSLVFLYQQMLWKKMGLNYPAGYTGINKIITSRLNQYDRMYTHEELEDLLQELRKLDVLSKSTSLKGVSLLHPVMVKICKGEHV